MDFLTQETLDFVRSNIILVAVILVGFFGYMVLLIRRRSRQNFLHQHSPEEKNESGS